MLRVVILHEPVNRKLLSNEWKESGFQDVAIAIGIHDAIKDSNLCGTMSTNARPDMNLQWMFWPRLSLCRLIDLPVASSLVLLERHRTLITENHVLKSVATFQNLPCEFQPLHLVGVSDELTICGPL